MFSGGLADRADVRREGGAQDDSALPDYVLAARSQSPHFYELPRRTHEPGREMEAEDQSRTRAARVQVGNHFLLLNAHCQGDQQARAG